MKTKILKFSLLGLGLVFAFFSWLSVDRAINVSDSSTWGVPIVLFSIWFVLLALFWIVASDKNWGELFLTSGGIFLSLFFAFSIFHFLVLLLSALLIIWAGKEIQKESESRIRISPALIVWLKRGLIILAFSLAISSQYYFTVKDRDQTQLIPRFRLEEFLGGNLEEMIIKNFLPENSGMENPELSIREAILENYYAEKMANNVPEIRDEKLRRIEEEKVVEAGRAELEKALGKKLQGDEKIGDLFSEMISQSVNEIVAPNLADGKSKAVPVVLALILFITIWSVGIFFSRLLGWAVGLIFWALKKTRLVEIEKIQIEKEIIKR
ncbi:MAG: hypothetical protein ACOYS2_02450 [Patescibacteria group bacterium]